MTTRIFVVAHIPADLEQAWLQHLRDFDVAHPGCHFEITASMPHRTVNEMLEMLEHTHPNFGFVSITPKKSGP